MTIAAGMGYAAADRKESAMTAGGAMKMSGWAAVGALALATFPGGRASFGADAPAAGSARSGAFSVRDFGAVGDGVADDTAAIQAALDAAKGADNTGAGRSVFSLYFPSVPGGFYKVTRTLVVDGTYGIVIHGDGAFTERGNEKAAIRWCGTE